jgi:hypothetical protein
MSLFSAWSLAVGEESDSLLYFHSLSLLAQLATAFLLVWCSQESCESALSVMEISTIIKWVLLEQTSLYLASVKVAEGSPWAMSLRKVACMNKYSDFLIPGRYWEVIRSHPWYSVQKMLSGHWISL